MPIVRNAMPLLVAAALCLFCADARAQEITGTITGVVTDQSGAILPGVTVTATQVQTSLVKEAITSADGLYSLSYLPVGTYDVAFTLSGFKNFTAKAIEVHVNDRLTLDAQLTVGDLSEVVEVVAAGTLIQSTPAVQSLMGATQVQELPLNNRNFSQLASLVPGVNSSLPDEVGVGLTANMSLSIAGNRRNGINWLVDGASNVDVGSNITLLSTPTLESIEEFKIITSGYNAEWPRSGGGIVNVVTKSGSNTFRGSGYEFFRDESLNANNFFRKQSTDPAIRDNPAALDYHNFGYTVGGPAQKDKLFFFFSQEWRKIERPSSVQGTVPTASWLTDPANANYVAPELRDPNAVRLLQAWPAANVGTNAYLDQRPNRQDTRQEVLRVDYQLNNRWRLMARYTHDLSDTTEAGGLFFNTALPDLATTLTEVPGQIFVGQLTTTFGSNMLNEVSFQYSSNAITSQYGENARNKRDAYNLAIPELFAENRNNLIPAVNISGLSGLGAPQLFDNDYKNYTIGNNFSYQRASHSYKMGLLVAFEQKNELAGTATQGTFTFNAGGGRTAWQNFLTGNRDGLCGAACTYSEVQTEVDNRFRFNRYEFYAQDSWRLRPNMTLDYGLRYSLFAPVTDQNNVLTTFDPELWVASQAPQLNAAGSVLVGTGNPINGIIVAGQNSPHGDAIYGSDKNNLQPRVGLSYDVFSDGRTVLRGGYGIYFDQPLVGIFIQNAQVNPPLASNPTVLNPSLSNPGAGTSATTTAPSALIASSDPFITPRTQQWNLGVQRQLYRRGVLDVGYVGSAGDTLIQPVDINQPQPQDVVRTGNVNLARPYLGYAGINMRQTTAKSRYNGLLVSFRHDQGRAGLINVAYTLSRTKTDATNDRDAVDLPQNPLDLEAEYAVARTDRTHVLTFNYVYELPFFREASQLLKSTLGGWQVAGITQMWSGPPISRVVNANTNGSRRGIRVNQVSDPLENLPQDVTGGVYWFNPAAFESPADGQYGNTGRSIFRLPGVHQWDITLSKNWYPVQAFRLQFRADFINAFNHTQLDPSQIQNTCPSNTSLSCVVAGNRFGQITGTRAPREIQLGIRMSWQ